MKRQADNSPPHSAAHRSTRTHHRRGSTTHYSHIRRVVASDGTHAPSPALHYKPIPGGSTPNITHSTICFMAQQDHSFPETFLPTTVLLIVDTGASISITNNLRDFISTPTPVQPTTLKGIASGLAVKAIGTTRYILTTDNGAPATITLPHTLYVPDCAMRLLCPRHMAATTGYPEDGFISYEQSGVLRYNGDKIPVSYHNDTCLPIVTAKIITDVPTGPNATSLPNHASLAAANSIPSTKPNLTNSQRLKLLWHERCNHRSMATINSWIRRGLLPIDPSVASAPDPVCAACQAGKAHRKPHAGHTNSIAAPCTFPGQAVSADQLEAGSPGKIPTTKGLPTTRRYRYCNLWIDHFSRFVFPTFHETKAASDLVASKREFQNFAARYNIKIKKDPCRQRRLRCRSIPSLLRRGWARSYLLRRWGPLAKRRGREAYWRSYSNCTDSFTPCNFSLAECAIRRILAIRSSSCMHLPQLVHRSRHSKITTSSFYR